MSVWLSKRACMRARLFAAQVLGIGRQMVADIGHDELAVGGGDQAHADGGNEHRPQHAHPRNAGGQTAPSFHCAAESR